MRKHHSEKQPMQHEGEESDDEYAQQMSLLAINKQAYSIPVAASNSSDRVQQVYNFNPNSYAGVNSATTAQVIFNVGSSFVNGPTSTILFSVNFPGAANTLAWSWGSNIAASNTSKSGSTCANIFKEVSLTARSGEIIERVINANVFAAAMGSFQKGIAGEYMLAGAGGASLCADNGIMGTTAAGKGTVGYSYPMYYCADTVYFELPLAKLLNFFGQAAPLPGATVLSGSKLTLTFDNFLNAMVFYDVPVRPDDNNGKPPVLIATPAAAAVPPSSVDIGNMQLNLDTMTLFDSSIQLIQAAASSLNSSGLQLSYYNVFQTRTTLQNASATIDVLLAASKLKDVIMVFRSGAAPSGGVDNMARLPLISYDGAANSGIFQGSGNAIGKLGASSNLRLRIGSNLNTLTPISNAASLYRYTVQALCDVKNGATSDIAPLHHENRPFDQPISFSDWYYGSGGTTIAFDVERSANLSISGSASNNSRAIQIEIENCLASAQNPIVLDIYVRFLSVANCSIENLIVDK
jgi:hypothetical protein